MRVISLGWGVQSFALAAMSALGVLPPVDAAVHADTGHERAETYAFAEKWTPWLEARGVRVVTVQAPDTRVVRHRSKSLEMMLPAHTSYPDDVWVEGGNWVERNGEEHWKPDGSRILAHRAGDPSGLSKRQCTREWKIRPLRRWGAAELKRRGLKKTPGVIEKWLGITLDEIERMRISSGVKYVTLRYPFIEMLDRPWTRSMAMRWLQDNDLPIPVKSSCVFCPYHARQAWRDIQLADNGDWEKALEVDRAIRHKRPGYLCYLTSARKPLDECDFRSQEEHGQLTLWEAEECQGMCFL